jgi:Na+-driven multidrug efflux pump
MDSHDRCLAIGRLGVIPLSVHTVPTQMLTVGFMIPLSVGIGLAVRLGAVLPHSVARAKALVWVTFTLSVVVFGSIALAMYYNRIRIVSIFTQHDDVMDGCAEIWHLVCFYYFHLAIFGVNMGIATGLGMQWTLGILTIVTLWIFGLPTAWYFGITKAASLRVVWDWIVPPYVIMNAFLLVAFVQKDWDVISRTIRAREGMDEPYKNGKVHTTTEGVTNGVPETKYLLQHDHL